MGGWGYGDQRGSGWGRDVGSVRWRGKELASVQGEMGGRGTVKTLPSGRRGEYSDPVSGRALPRRKRFCSTPLARLSGSWGGAGRASIWWGAAPGRPLALESGSFVFSH